VYKEAALVRFREGKRRHLLHGSCVWALWHRPDLRFMACTLWKGCSESKDKRARIIDRRAGGKPPGSCKQIV
jgi:hypothetical protein